MSKPKPVCAKLLTKDKIKKLKANNKQFEDLFFKLYFNFLNICECSPAISPGCHKSTCKSQAKCSGTNTQSGENAMNIPDAIPADGHDICNYVARYGMANFQIQAVMKLDGRLDYDRLSKAVRLSVDAEPVLGCRFVESDPPYWKRLDNLDGVEFCTLIDTDDPETAIKDYLESPLDMDNGPLVKLGLIRSGQNDSLVVKVNHVCADGAGAKEYIHLLADMYSRIDSKGGGNYRPVPSVRNKDDHKRLLDSLDIKDPNSEWSPMKRVPTLLWKFPWKNGRTGATRFAVCRFSDGQLDQMHSYAKARGATINDLLLTGIYRAMFKISKTPYGLPMDIPVTIDLRRYLPDQKAEAIRNLTGGYIIRIARKAHETFDGTLSRVISDTKTIKNGHPGINYIHWAERVEKMPFRSVRSFFKNASKTIEVASRSPFHIVDKCGITLSNFGFVSREPLIFGERVATDAYIIPPVVRAPGILLVASSYNGITTLAIGYYKPSVRSTDMERVLDKIKGELVQACCSPEADRPLSFCGNDFSGMPETNK